MLLATFPARVSSTYLAGQAAAYAAADLQLHMC